MSLINQSALKMHHSAGTHVYLGLKIYQKSLALTLKK